MADNRSQYPVFATDDTCIYMLVTIPAHNRKSYQISKGVNAVLFNSLYDVIAIGNGTGIGVGKTAIDIIFAQVHDRVAEMLKILQLRMKIRDKL